MGIAPETKLVVKRTFLEYVEMSPARKDLRLRAQTDSALVSGLACQDLPHLGAVPTGADDVCTFNMCDGAPEFSSAGVPRPDDQQSCAWECSQWCPDSYNLWMHCYESSAWGPCMVPAGFATGYPVSASCAPSVGQSLPWVTLDSNCASINFSADVVCGGRPSAVADLTDSVGVDIRTTVMLRNLPNDYTREMLLDLVDTEGFAGTYDFVYLPIDFNSQAGLGYAFVNLLSPVEAQRFWKHFEGFSRWMLPSDKVARLDWSKPHQGLESHIERYRNSPVMHKAVSDECKPMIFVDGVRVPFPPPTKEVKAPRLRTR